MNSIGVFQSSYWARTFLLLAWYLPLLGLFLNSFPLSEHFPPPGTGYYDSGRTILAVLCLLGFLFSNHHLRWPTSLPGRLFSLFLLWSLLSCLISGTVFETLLFWQTWAAVLFFFLGVRRVGLKTSSIVVRTVCVHVPILLFSANALLPILYEPEFLRIGGVFDLAGVLANWLLLLLPVCLYDALDGKGVPACLAGLAGALALVAICYTFSRASWIIALFTLGMSPLLAGKFEFRRFGVAIGWVFSGTLALVFLRAQMSTQIWAVAFLVLVFLPLVAETFCKRVHGTHLLKLGSVLLLAGLLVWGLTFTSSMQSARDMTSRRMDNLKSYDNSSQARVQLWIAAAKMAASNPWVGVGPGEFASNYPRYQTRFYYYSDSAHSAGLELASEVGIVGLAFFTAGLLVLLYPGSRKLDPLQRFALLGLFCGLGYAQIDLAYQFSYFWLTIAVLCHLALPPASNPVPDNRVSPLRAILGIVAVGLAFYLVPPLRQMEGARQIKDPQQSLEVHQSVLERLPWWRRAVISAYQIKLEETETLPTLEETTQLLEYGEGLAITHALAGKWYLRNDQFEQALQEYRKALELDPWNDPRYYGDLRRIGVALSDQTLIREAEDTLLSKYSLEESRLAPPGHRDFLQLRLQQTLLELADSLNPFEQPLKTEPIYRALYEFEPGPNAAFGLGVSLHQQGRTEEARPYLEEAHRKHPMFPPPGSF